MESDGSDNRNHSGSDDPVDVDDGYDPQANLNEEQKQMLSELRERAQMELDTLNAKPRLRKWVTDACLCRYLRARNWNLDKADAMLKSSLKWRQEEGKL